MPLSAYAVTWLSSLSTSLITAKAACGSLVPEGMERNEPPMFAGPPGMGATRQSPEVSAVALLRSAWYQEAPRSAGSDPLLMADAQSGLPSVTFAVRPSFQASTARSHAALTVSLSPVKSPSSSTKRVVPWPSDLVNTSDASTKIAPPVAALSFLPNAK